MEIHSFTFGPFQTNTYVVDLSEGGNRHVLLIDPACYYQKEQQVLYEYIERLRTKTGGCVTILATHGHLDHLWGARWATERWNTAVWMHPSDVPMAEAMQQQYDLFGIPGTPRPFAIEPLLVPSLRMGPMQVIHTPGHTPGSVCLYWPDEQMLISGDTLFRDGYGRTDLPGGNMEQLVQSLGKLWTLPAGTRVYSGHGEPGIISSR